MAIKRGALASIAVVTVMAVLLGACSSSDKKSAPPSQQTTVDLTGAKAASFTTGGSVGQVYVTGAHPGATLRLVNSDGSVIAHTPADAHGSLIFRTVPVATGYRVAAGTGASLVASKSVNVTSWTSPPPESFYAAQKVKPGYGYLRMRDGTLALDDREASRSGRQGSVPDGHRVLRLLAGRSEVAAAEHARSRRPSATRPSASTCAAPVARRARSATSSSCSRPTGTTRSRRSPRSRGSRTTRSEWSASRIPGSASCSSRSSGRRTSRRSRRCR